MANESCTGSKLSTLMRSSGANFSKHVLTKTTTMQRINTHSIFNLMPYDLTSSVIK